MPVSDAGFALEDGMNTRASSGVLERHDATVERDTLMSFGLDFTSAAAESELVGELRSSSDVPAYSGNTVKLLIDGPDTYERMFAAIRAAASHIFLETYIFADDQVGRQFADALMRKCSAGVRVYVIYDAVGSLSSDDEFFVRMERAGIAVVAFNAINPVDGGNPLLLNNRSHRKLLVVDGVEAFTGGINLTSTYASRSGARRKRNPTKEGWRDTHVVVRGPAVEGFERAFIRQWRKLDRLPIEIPDPPPARATSGKEIVAILTSNGGNGGDSPIFEAYIDAMRRASKRIWITQAYFAPDGRFLELLLGAARRGVDVRLLLPGFTDSRLVLHASRSRYGKLIKTGVRVFEAQDALLHAKTAVIDGIWSTVGSSNLDYRSFLHNDEINAVVLGAEFARELEAQFERDAEACREIALDEWKQRPLTHRLAEHLSWIVEYWL